VAQQTGKPQEKTGSDKGSDKVLDDPFQWPFAAAKLAMDTCLWWLDRGSTVQHETTLAWTTTNTVALQLATMRLRNYSKKQLGQPILICAPCALHRASIADFAPGHSVVESLQSGGTDRVYVTDWRSASPNMRLLSIDSYLSDLNIAIDEIGAPVDLVGLCQGGWLSLIYAARFPAKVRRLVLVGAPVDLSIDSALSRLVRASPKVVYDQLIARGGGNVSGKEMLRLWTKLLSRQDIEVTLQRSLSDEDGEVLFERFNHWNDEVLDLPGIYYLQIVNWIFRENRIAAGNFVALGHEIHLKEVRTPVFLLAGLDDDVVPAEQTLATAHLLGTPPPFIAAISEPCNHLGLFMGTRTHAHAWMQIAEWLRTDLPDAPACNA